MSKVFKWKIDSCNTIRCYKILFQSQFHQHCMNAVWFKVSLHYLMPIS